MRHLGILFFLLISVLTTSAQNTIRLGLDDAIRLAQSQSLQAFLIKNYYLADYWHYRSFRADYLPSVTLTSKLFNYNNSSNLRYNSATRTDEFHRTENMSLNANLNVNQKIAWTGGTLHLNSNLGRIQNYGERGFLQYSSTPVQIGYTQSLFGFNTLKWELKTEPIKFEKAKKEYIESVEDMNMTTVSRFFQLASAELNLKLAAYNFHQTDTLLQIAEKRFKLGTVSRDELLDLRLNKNNTGISLQEAELRLRRTKESFLTFLMLPTETNIRIQLPENVPSLQIDAQEALQAMLLNNPEVVQQELEKIQAHRNVAKAKADNRFTADLSLNVGINKNNGRYDYSNEEAMNGTIANVYQPDFDARQIVNVGVTVPILDWGKGKGRYEMAKSQQKIAEIAAQQALQQLQQNTVTKVLEFNLLKDKVASAALSDELAAESYQLMVVRFRKGNADVLRLVTSQQAKANAEMKYISALSDYWLSYYGMRKIALFDFEANKPLSFDPDAIIEQARNQ